ncbi:MAG: hypothetical protein MI861_23550, partial [Pirellulales bacterium]|nr:hypothetical protein [Pirellulales bacterium]
MLERVRGNARAAKYANDRYRDLPVNLSSIALATPPHRIPQDLAQTLAGRIFGDRYPDFARMSKTFDNSGIESRYSVSPPDWFLSERHWPERNQTYLTGAVS